MTDIDANLAYIKNSGFKVIGYFTLPETAWMESYSHPLENRLQLLRRKYAAIQGKFDMIDMFEVEIDMYLRYSDYFGYVFFMMQKTES